MRSIATQKLGYFPLSPSEAERIRHFLVFPSEEASALDPCAGAGATALKTLPFGSITLPQPVPRNNDFRMKRNDC